MNSHQPTHHATLTIDEHSADVVFVYPTARQLMNAMRGGELSILQLTLDCIHSVGIDGKTFNADDVGIDILRAVQERLFTGGARGNSEGA